MPRGRHPPRPRERQHQLPVQLRGRWGVVGGHPDPQGWHHDLRSAQEPGRGLRQEIPPFIRALHGCGADGHDAHHAVPAVLDLSRPDQPLHRPLRAHRREGEGHLRALPPLPQQLPARSPGSQGRDPTPQAGPADYGGTQKREPEQHAPCELGRDHQHHGHEPGCLLLRGSEAPADRHLLQAQPHLHGISHSGLPRAYLHPHAVRDWKVHGDCGVQLRDADPALPGEAAQCAAALRAPRHGERVLRQADRRGVSGQQASQCQRGRVFGLRDVAHGQRDHVSRVPVLWEGSGGGLRGCLRFPQEALCRRCDAAEVEAGVPPVHVGDHAGDEVGAVLRKPGALHQLLPHGPHRVPNGLHVRGVCPRLRWHQPALLEWLVAGDALADPDRLLQHCSYAG
eukprot:RCo021097